MSDISDLRAVVGPTAESVGSVVFTVANERFGLSLPSVQAISVPPAIAAMPHALPALLGVGNLGGQIVPIIDALPLLRPTAAARTYDGRGEILQLHTAEGNVGLWVDRVEALTGNRLNPGEASFELLDPGTFLATALEAPPLAGPEFMPVDDQEQSQTSDATIVAAAPVAPQQASVLLGASGAVYAIGQTDVLELLEHVAWTPIPRAPAEFLGVAILRGSALPVLCLSRLLGFTVEERPGGFALIRFGECRILLAVERVIGLGSGAEYEAIDLRSLIPGELSEIVVGFSAATNTVVLPVTLAAQCSQFLSLTLGQQQFALPVSAVEQVIEATPLIPLPRGADDDEFLCDTAGAIELRGQIIPVAAVYRRLGLAESEIRTPVAYLIIRSNAGHSAVGVDRIGELMSLPPEAIASPPGEPGLIAGVAVLGGTEPLSIIAPEHLWRTF